ncbi:AMP-binding protein [Paraburkholderia ferrariae]|uniref:AMP-binding protein n=1 Tax=Paraburkholderia ferrariae TaxID=386056 RepID=UPI0004852E79|nr:AMP-binding protein [Paraburkholderia ferrariae]
MSEAPWLASYGSIPAQIDPDVYPSLAHLFDDAMRRFATRSAFHAAGRTLSYADVDRLSRAFAAYLQQRLGVKRGDRVAVMMPNLAAFPIALLGIVRAGAVQVNVNPLYTPRELEHQLNDAGVETIVVFEGSLPTVEAVRAKTGLKTVIATGLLDGLAEAAPAPGERAGVAATFAQTLADGASLPFEPVALTGDDALFLQYTGGTTGLSKGALLTHRNLVANVVQFKAFMPGLLGEDDEVIVTALPLYHIFALTVNLIVSFSIGAENWLVANPRDLDSLIDIFKAAQPTTFMGVNTLYAGLAGHPRIGEVDFSRLRLAGGGGSATMAAVSARWEAVTGTFIREGYGLSETSPVVSFNPGSVHRFTGSAGLPVPSTDIKLINDGVEAAPGEAGEICVKGPQVMKGYWNHAEATRTAFTPDGYFRTGDVGVIDAQGFLRIVDRSKDMILVSGFNVYPNEVEEVATALAGVAECACIGVPDERTGEAVKLFVVMRLDAALTEEAVIAHCRAQLAAYKVPRVVRFVESLPKSTVGKILRRELRTVN